MAADGIGIGEAARRSGCTIETIRYYERIALLPKPARNASRYRVYAAADVARLAFIRRARELGFALGEIRDLLRLAADAGRSCAEVRAVAARRLGDLRAKIADLHEIERELAAAVSACERGEQAECPVIAALSSRPGAAPPLGGGTSGRARQRRRRRQAARR